MSMSDTIIIGAGPYGLTIAAYLRSAQIPFRIFGSPMESWRAFMPEGMILKSERFASGLWDPRRKFTFERFSAQGNIPYRKSGEPLSLAQFLQYAEWFRASAVGEVTNVKIDRIRRGADGFTLDAASGEVIAARRVILATGHMAFRYIPEQLIGLPEPLCFHSTRFGDVHAYKGREVVVIGAGQSALETAVLLHEAGANVRLMAKIEAPEWNHSPKSNRTILDSVVEPESGLGFGWKALALSELPQIFRWRFSPEVRHRFVANSWGPAGAWWMRKRFEGVIDGLFGSQIESAAEVGGRVRLTVDGPGGKKVIETDHVIAGTGFKVDVDRLEFIDASLRSEIAREFSAPVLDSHFETSVPGLFIVGVASAPTFGPVMRFMFGAKHVAPALTRRLSARRS
jgi:thioredoxin reductase